MISTNIINQSTSKLWSLSSCLGCAQPGDGGWPEVAQVLDPGLGVAHPPDPRGLGAGLGPRIQPRQDRLPALVHGATPGERQCRPLPKGVRNISSVNVDISLACRRSSCLTTKSTALTLTRWWPRPRAPPRSSSRPPWTRWRTTRRSERSRWRIRYVY